LIRAGFNKIKSCPLRAKLVFFIEISPLGSRFVERQISDDPVLGRIKTMPIIRKIRSTNTIPIIRTKRSIRTMPINSTKRSIRTMPIIRDEAEH